MTCNLEPQCNFLYGFFLCKLLEDTIDMEITMRMMKGIHTFKKVCNNKTSSCSPLGLQVHPFPSLVKKMEIYLEERGILQTLSVLPIPTPIDPPDHLLQRHKTPKKKKTGEARKRSRKVNPQAKRKQFKMRKLEEPFSLSEAAVPTFMLAPMPTASIASTAMATLQVPFTTATATLPVSFKLPSTLNTPTVPKPQGSSQTSKTWPRPYTPVPLTAPVHSDWSLDEEWDGTKQE